MTTTTEAKVAPGDYVGPIVTFEHAMANLPRASRMVHEAIMQMGFDIALNNHETMEVPVHGLAKALGIKPEAVEDAIRDLNRRVFHVVRGPKEVVEFPIVLLAGALRKEVGRTAETLLVGFAYNLVPEDAADESWQKGTLNGAS